MSINLVKIHATASTNEALKSRFRESELPELTTVFTHHQTAGKGQMGAVWNSEPFKNLTFSILIKESFVNYTDIQINQFITVVVVEWLREKLQVKALIKWPNDILSVHHKLAGILIENIRSGEHRRGSIVGIGLNVNQDAFNDLPKAISLSQITGKRFNVESLLIEFLTYLQSQLAHINSCINRYNHHFYKINQLTTFKANGSTFQALVEGVDAQGRLVLLKEGHVCVYDLKEIQWIY